jgi:UV DNA damage endonuclease
MGMRLGYACINMALDEAGIKCNRGMIRRTFDSRGIDYASSLALENLTDLAKVVEWNSKNDFFVYRMSSCLFPWMSEYEISEIPRFEEIEKACRRVGDIAKASGQRLSFHPGQFNIMSSSSEKLVIKTAKDLNQHAEIMDLMGLPRTFGYPINIHVGGAYGDKTSAMERFVENFKKHLTESTQKRLVVENDDKGSMFSVSDLYWIWTQTDTPVTFDYHHHRFCPGGLSEEEALLMAASTWPEGIRPMTHYSSCRKTFEDGSQKAQAHADYIYEKINDYGLEIDIEIESKAKERAVIRYRKEAEAGSLLNEYLNFDYAGTSRTPNHVGVHQ